MKIKKASIEDLEIVTTLFDLYRQFYKQGSDLKSAREFLSERINKNESVIFLVVDEETDTGWGFVQLYPAFSSVSMKPLWILNDLFVHEEHRKLGVAEALMEKARELAVETDASGIVLETGKSNTKAQNLYDKVGYERDREHYYFFLKIK